MKIQIATIAVLLLLAAAGITEALARTCTTTCYGNGNTRTCTTSCF